MERSLVTAGLVTVSLAPIAFAPRATISATASATAAATTTGIVADFAFGACITVQVLTGGIARQLIRNWGTRSINTRGIAYGPKQGCRRYAFTFSC
jgi:hypothetical protein